MDQYSSDITKYIGMVVERALVEQYAKRQNKHHHTVENCPCHGLHIEVKTDSETKNHQKHLSVGIKIEIPNFDKNIEIQKLAIETLELTEGLRNEEIEEIEGPHIAACWYMAGEVIF